jgi:hypothetical protein
MPTWPGTPKTWTPTVVTVSDLNTELRDRFLVVKTSIADDGTLASNGGVLTTPELKAYKETKTGPAIAGGTLTLDLALGNHFQVALNANITTLTLANVPTTGYAAGWTLVLIADGSQRTITWPAAYKWPSGVAPIPTATNGKADLYSFLTFTEGVTIYSFVGGQSM